MTAAWRGANATAAAASALSVSVTLPTGIANGDLGYIAHTYNPTTGATTTPAGWTLVRTDAFSATAETKLYRKSLVTGDSGATVTFTNAGSQRMSAAVGVLTGIGAEDVVNVRVENLTTPATNTAPTATAGATDVQMVFWTERSSTPSTAMTSAPAGVTIATGGSAFGVGSGACSAVVGYNLTPVSAGGTLGGGAWDPDVSNNAVTMYVIGISVPADATASLTETASITATLAIARSAAASRTTTAAITATADAIPGSGPVVTVQEEPRPRSFRIEVFDENLNKLGRVGRYLTADLVLKHLEVGSWSILMNLEEPAAALLSEPGRRVTIDFEEDGSRLMSGPMDSFEEIAEVGGQRTIAFAGYDDKWWLDQRVAYPTPGATFPAPGTSFTQPNYVDIRTGTGEGVAKGFVTANAVTRFAIPHLTVAPNLGRGTTVTFNARMHSLLWMVTIATTYSGIGFKVDQVGSDLVFDVYAPQSQPVRLSTRLGNLAGYRYKELSPLATDAIGGGTGDGTLRKYMQKSRSASAVGWGQREKYVDLSDAATDAELSLRITDYLIQSAPTAGFSLTPRDTRSMRFGRDYNVGDNVTVELPSGLQVSDTVREVRLSHTTADGMVITPGIGYSQSTDPTAAIYRRYAALRDEVANMKRSV